LERKHHVSQSLFALAAAALLPTFAIAAPATSAIKPAVAHAQTIEVVPTRQAVHHALKKAKMNIKAKVAPAKKV